MTVSPLRLAYLRIKAAATAADEGEDNAPAYPGSPMRGWQWKALLKQQGDAERSWMPRVFRTEATPLVELLASPARQGILGGAAGALGGAGLGALAGALGGDSGAGALVGGGLGAALGGTVAYRHRRRQNDVVMDALRRTPPGATLADFKALQATDARQQHPLGRTKVAAGWPLKLGLGVGVPTVGAGAWGLWQHGGDAVERIGNRFGTGAAKGIEPTMNAQQEQLNNTANSVDQKLTAHQDRLEGMVDKVKTDIDQRLQPVQKTLQTVGQVGQAVRHPFRALFGQPQLGPDGQPAPGTGLPFGMHPGLAVGLGLGAGALAGGLMGGQSTETDAQGRPVKKRRMWPALFGAGLGGLGAAGLVAARQAGKI